MTERGSYLLGLLRCWGSGFISVHFCGYCACASSCNAIGFDCPSVHIPAIPSRARGMTGSQFDKLTVLQKKPAYLELLLLGMR